MSNYTKSTNFATKDALAPGNPLKIVRGTEIDTEFNNIATAVTSKSDSISPTFTGTVTVAALTASGATTLTSLTASGAAVFNGASTVNGVAVFNAASTFNSNQRIVARLAVIAAGDANYSTDIQTQSAATLGLRVRGVTSQTAALQEWSAVSGSVLASIGASGTLTLSGAAINEAAEVSLASANTVDLGATASNSVLITGTTQINSFGTAAAGIKRSVRMAGVLVIAGSASITLPGVANITTATNDTFTALSFGGGTWVVLSYQRASGAALSAVGVGQTWQDVTASRAYSTNYTNSTGKPILIVVTGAKSNLANGEFSVTVAGVIVAYAGTNGNGGNTGPDRVPITAVVPDGAVYSAQQVTATTTLVHWAELR